MNRIRKIFQRLIVVIGVGCVLVVVRSIKDHVVAQEDRSWMISSSAIRGLSGGRMKTQPTDSKLSWMAKVKETEWQYIVIHHTATESGSVESIHEEHLNRRDAEGNPWLGIGYHFVIGNGQGMPDGTVQATFRWQEQIQGAHSGSEVFNARGIGICLIGN
ncbi:MAG: peptidoglycan recognition family protein, partial [Planctomycetaceae bacterium]